MFCKTISNKDSLQLGMTLYLEPHNNACRHFKSRNDLINGIKSATVTTIGKKYFTVSTNEKYPIVFKFYKEEAEKVSGIHTINSKCSKCKNGAVVVGCALNAEPDSPYCHKHCEPYSSSLII